MSGGRKSRTGDARRSSGRNMPTILGRKRKSEEEESAQPVRFDTEIISLLYRLEIQHLDFFYTEYIYI